MIGTLKKALARRKLVAALTRALDQREWDAAEAHCEQLLGLDPADTSVHFALATARAARGAPQDAVAPALAALTTDGDVAPEDVASLLGRIAVALHNDGSAAALRGEHALARERLEAVLRVDRAVVGPARQAMERVLALAGGDVMAKARHNLALSCEDEDPDRAVLLYSEALALWPAAHATLVRLARLHHRAHRFDEAISLYQRALATHPADADEARRMIDVWLGDARARSYR